MENRFDVHTILTADVGAATTKMSLFKADDTGYTLLGAAGAPTTWSPGGDEVMVGVMNALSVLEEKTGRVLSIEGRPLVGAGDRDRGADIFLVVTSAAGGMRLLCLGLVRMMTAESAERAALGAGATVSAVVAADDGRSIPERLDVIGSGNADMILMAGGTDDGTVDHVVALAEYLVAAHPRPRLGEEGAIPIIFAGNVVARDPVVSLLSSVGEVHVVDNLRPTLDRESLEPVRDIISNLYLEHVAERTPGYGDLLYATGGALEPSPAAQGRVLRAMSDHFGVNILCIDAGASTTDVFSVMKGVYNRSVSADIGVGASADGVFSGEEGVSSVARWMNRTADARALENWIMNRTLRPGTVPADADELDMFCALGREVLRRAFAEHRDLVVTLRGVKQQRTFDDTFEQTKTGLPLVEPSALDVIIGTGSILSASTSPGEAALMLLDGIAPAGISRLYIDAYGLLGQIGALMERAPGIEEDFFHRWLTPLGTVVAPQGESWGRRGTPVAEMYLTPEDGERQYRVLRVGELDVVPVSADETIRVEVVPRKNYDLGDGPGTRVAAEVRGGAVGLIIDVRGRPLKLPRSEAARLSTLERWRAAMGSASEEGEVADAGLH